MEKKDGMYDKLKEKFPKEAYGEDKSRGFTLDTIDAYYVIERLNEVFGLCGEGWKLIVNEWIKLEDEVICLATFQYGDKSFPCVGGKKVIHERWTDAYKSAMTNAICKGSSFIGIGLDVYKGEFAENGKTKQEIQSPQPAQSPQPPKTTGKGITAKQEDKLQQIRKSHLINEDEKVEIQKIIGQKDGIKASEKIKDWWGEDWKGGMRQQREYIDEYIKAKTKDMGEPQKELVNNFRNEAEENISGLEPSKIAVLIKELKDE